MMVRLVQHIKKTGGKVENREKLLKWFNRVLDKMQNGDVVLEFRPTDRTDAQNRYYWVLIHQMAKEVGVSSDDMHKLMKEMYLPSREYILFTRKRQLSSTTDQNAGEMSEYIDNVIRFATEDLDMVVPDIEEYKHGV